MVEFRLADSENCFKNMVEVNLEIHNFISIVNLHGSAELNFKMECPIFGCEHKKKLAQNSYNHSYLANPKEFPIFNYHIRALPAF